MSRRHFFDKGYPVCNATLIAGSYVLLAVSHQSVRKSRIRLASSLLQMANTSQRVMHSLAHHLLGHPQTPYPKIIPTSRRTPRASEAR